MNEDEAKEKYDPERNTAEVNVTAYREINNKPQGIIKNLFGKRFNIVLYDGDVVINHATYSIGEWFGEKTIPPGFFKRLEDVAEGVKGILLEEAQDLEDFQREDIHVNYHSDTNEDSTFGSRGYTSYSGSYLQRPLNDSEMEKLVREVDTRIRPLFYQRKE